MDDARLNAPAATRNRDPILLALAPYLRPGDVVLEIASGTGEHVVHFAARQPRVRWQPTDPLPEHRASIDAWGAGCPNILPALHLDARDATWPAARADVVLCINMIHISPWPATIGLIAGAARLLPPNGVLALYGPYRRRGQPMQPGNAAFDASLRGRDPAWGVREVETVAALAAASGFTPPIIVSMPADNLMLFFHLNI